jgi:hypothetical protein
MQRLLYRKTIKGQNLNRNQERGWTPRDSLDKKKRKIGEINKMVKKLNTEGLMKVIIRQENSGKIWKLE